MHLCKMKSLYVHLSASADKLCPCSAIPNCILYGDNCQFLLSGKWSRQAQMSHFLAAHIHNWNTVALSQYIMLAKDKQRFNTRCFLFLRRIIITSTNSFWQNEVSLILESSVTSLTLRYSVEERTDTLTELYYLVEFPGLLPGVIYHDSLC